MNINLIYDWIVNADQYEQKFGAELAAGNLPDVFMVNQMILRIYPIRAALRI